MDLSHRPGGDIMKKEFLTFFLTLSLLSIAFESTPVRAEGAVLEKLKATYRQSNSWNADFSQATYVEVLGREVKKNGEIYLKKPGKMKISYKGERGKSYISNGQKLWIYTEGDTQVQVFKKISSVVSTEALAFLQGLGDLEKEFRIKSAEKGTVKPQNSALSLLELFPKKKGSPLTKVILGVEPKTGMVEEAFLFNTSGNNTHYVFKNIRLNANLEDRFFEFDKPSGVTEVSGL